MTVTITGTGVPNPAPGRAGPGVLVRVGDTALQFDAGRATALRITEAGLSVTDLTAVFVTHHHSDHLSGLADVIFARWVMLQTGYTPLPVVAPNGPSTTFLERMFDPWADDIAVRLEHTGRPDGPDIDIVGFDAPESSSVVWSNDDVEVMAVSVRHEPVTPSVAYVVRSDDGAVLISGDTRVCEEIEQAAADVDVVVHEALRTGALRPAFDRLPQLERITHYHADTVELGGLASRAEVPLLVLTHLIPAPSTPEQVAGFEADIREGGYEGPLVVAEDLLTVTLDNGTASVIP